MPQPTSTDASGRSLDQHRELVADLVDETRPTSARDVLATALLGAAEPTLPVSHLIEVARLFGISPGATRTCLWRMVTSGDLTTDKATYSLTGRMLDRRRQIDADSRAPHDRVSQWDGTWEMAVVALDRRGQMDRIELRKAAGQLRLAELKEGVWIRPSNLDPSRAPEARAILREQCIEFRRAETELDREPIDGLFHLTDWATSADRLFDAMEGEDHTSGSGTTTGLQFQFSLSVAVVHHLGLDPLLPRELLPDRWPAETLRRRYHRFDRSFQQRMWSAVTQRPRPNEPLEH